MYNQAQQVNKVRLYWTLQVGGWLAFALGQIIVYQSQIEWELAVFWLLEAGLFLACTHLLRTVMIRTGWLALNMAKLIPRAILAVLVMAVALYFLRLFIAFPLGINDSLRFWRGSQILGLTSVYALVFFVWVVLYVVYHYFENYNRGLRHEAAMNEIELNNLKSQLNPHFIFNALNSIRALVDENPQKCKKAITQLSNILRNSLASDKNKLTKFQDELLMVTAYLGLESIRFEERLKTEFDIDENSYNFLVPPLMLQTLVENGIKHGISKLKKGGFIKVKTSVVDEKLKIQIRNSGFYENGKKENKNGGLGLSNTSKRLNLLYHDDAEFKVFNEDEDTVLTELIIPKSN